MRPPRLHLKTQPTALKKLGPVDIPTFSTESAHHATLRRLSIAFEHIADIAGPDAGSPQSRVTPSRHREPIAGTVCNGGFSGEPLRIGQ